LAARSGWDKRSSLRRSFTNAAREFVIKLIPVRV
jgi:hypothetical protein